MAPQFTAAFDDFVLDFNDCFLSLFGFSLDSELFISVVRKILSVKKSILANKAYILTEREMKKPILRCAAMAMPALPVSFLILPHRSRASRSVGLLRVSRRVRKRLTPYMC